MQRKIRECCFLAIFALLNFGFLNVTLAESTTVTSNGIKFPDGTTQTTAASGGGSSVWSQSGSNIYYSGGNVGIGTSNPETALRVDGSMQNDIETFVEPLFIFGNPDPRYAALFIHAAAGHFPSTDMVRQRGLLGHTYDIQGNA